jgi:hypothetical protein
VVSRVVGTLHGYRYRADVRSCMNVVIKVFCGTVNAAVKPVRDQVVGRAVTMKGRSGKDL